MNKLIKDVAQFVFPLVFVKGGVNPNFLETYRVL